MKSTMLKVAAAAALMPTLANAGVTITPMATYQYFDEIAHKQVLPQLALGYRFDDGMLKDFGIDLVVNGGSVELGSGSNNHFNNGAVKPESDVLQYRIDGKYFLPQFTSLPLEFYAAAGVGAIQMKDAVAGSPVALAGKDKEDYFQFNVGGGAMYGFTENLKGVLDARYLGWKMDGNNAPENRVDDAAVSLGLQYDFGGKKPAPVVVKEQPVNLDLDGDGVPNNLDKCPNTPRGYAVDARGCTKQLMQPVSMPLRILFDTNKAVVKPQYNGEIAKAANFMKQYPTSTTVIEGHTDSRGSAKYNQQLSQRRANAVKAAIIRNHGINPARIKAMGYGEAKPVASNATADGRAQNRRVVAVISGKKKVTQRR